MTTVFRVTKTERYGYDASGRLVRIGGNALLWQGDNPYALLDSTGATFREFSYYPGLDQAQAWRSGTTNYHAYTAHDGSVISVTDDSGTSSGVIPYGTWGESGGWGFGPGWKGALSVPISDGLYYMRARWYERGRAGS